jgi:hypothetical protein
LLSVVKYLFFSVIEIQLPGRLDVIPTFCFNVLGYDIYE